MRYALLVVLALFAVPAQAATIGAEAFATTAMFAPLSNGMPDEIAVVSGALDATFAADPVLAVLMDTQGSIHNVAQVCWGTDFQRDCATDGPYSIHVQPNGSVALRLPGDSGASLVAGHAFATFLDANQSFGDVRIGHALAAGTVNGTASFFPAPIAEFTPSFGDSFEDILDQVGVMALIGTTVVEIHDASGVIKIVGGQDTPAIGFTGAIASSVWPIEAAVLGFESGEALFTPPTTEDVAQGFDVARIQSLVTAVQTGQYTPPDACVDCAAKQPFGIDPATVQAILREVLGASLVRVPIAGGVDPTTALASTLIRYESLTASANGTMVNLAGSAPLIVESGKVQGAEDVHGVSFLQLPWWGWTLWVLAFAAAVAVAIRKPEKKHPIDKWGLVGFAAGLVALVVVFFLWDAQFARVFGTSMLQTSSSGTSALAVLALQLAVFGYVYGAAIVPLHLVLARSIRLAGYGKGARAAFPVAVLIGYFLGAHLLLSYIEIILAQVANQ